MADQWIDPEVAALEETMGWRERKGFEFLDDDRNLKAAKLLRKLAEGVRLASDGSAAELFRGLQDFLISDGNPHEDDADDVFKAWSSYRSAIGFRYFPASADEYLLELVNLAAGFSRTASYIAGSKL